MDVTGRRRDGLVEREQRYSIYIYKHTHITYIYICVCVFCSSYLYNNSGKQWRHTHTHARAGTLLLVVNNNNEYYNAARAYMCINIQRRAYCMYNRVRISSTGLPAIRCCHKRDIHIYIYNIPSLFFLFFHLFLRSYVCARVCLLILTHTIACVYRNFPLLKVYRVYVSRCVYIPTAAAPGIKSEVVNAPPTTDRLLQLVHICIECIRTVCVYMYIYMLLVRAENVSLRRTFIYIWTAEAVRTRTRL